MLNRPAFDCMLRDAVENSSITTVAGTVAAGERSVNGWKLTLADGVDVSARFVIDCSGRAAVIARRVGLQRRADRLVSLYGFVNQTGNDVEPSPATMIEAVESGWWYATILSDLRMSLAFFSDPDCLPRGVTRDAKAWAQTAAGTRFVSRWLESADYAIIDAPRLASAGTTWLEPIAGLNWAAAGDAAAAFDPLSSHGLTTALWSGRRAALAATSALDGDGEPLAHYVENLQEAIRSFLTARSSVYARERRFAGFPFWMRRGLR